MDFRAKFAPDKAEPAEHNGHIWSRAPTPYGTNFAGKTLQLLLLLRQLYIRKLPLTRYCRSNNCHAFRLPRKGREKRHFNHLINAALQSSVYGHFIAALIRIRIATWKRPLTQASAFAASGDGTVFLLSDDGNVIRSRRRRSDRPHSRSTWPWSGTRPSG